MKLYHNVNESHIAFTEFEEERVMISGKRKIVLASMVLSILLGGGAEASTYTLKGITVNGDRVTYDDAVSSEEEAKWLPGGYERKESYLGLTGDTPVMKQPYQVTSFSAKAMEQMVPANGSIDQVLANVPSVRIGTSPIKTDFSVRGMLANGSSMYVNGIPGFYIMVSGPMPNMSDRADVLVGPAATLTGSVQSYNGPDGGQPVSVFLHTKRPEVNLNRITISNSGYGDWGYQFDVSRKNLGANGEWGVRAYGMYDEGGMAISGASRRRKDIFLDVEHKDRKSTTNLFAGSFDDRLWGTERRFLIDRTGSRIPSAPDATKSYDDPHFMHQFDYGNLIVFNHEQKINDHFDWFLNAGAGETTIRRFIYWSQIPIDENGKLKGAQVWSQHFLMQNKYGQLGLKSHFDTGEIHHDFTISLDRSYRKHYNATRKDKKGQHVTGSIYDGIIYNPSMYRYDNSATLGNTFMYQEMDTGLNFVDSMKYKKWTLLAAANRRHGNYRGKDNHSIRDEHWAPTFGLTYAANDDFSAYASYSKATTRGEVVGAGYVNEGERLKPLELTQKEVGMKYKYRDLLFSLAYFDMNQPNTIDITRDDGIYEEMNGKNRYRGIDFNVTGALSDKWNLFGGFEYLHARQVSTIDGAYDGMPTDSSAKWSTVMGLEYHPNDHLSFLGRMNYTGHGIITGPNRNELTVPSYTTFDFFVNYKTKWGRTPVKLSASLYNAFNKDHWVLQPGQGSKLMLDMPRTFVLSASFDF